MVYTSNGGDHLSVHAIPEVVVSQSFLGAVITLPASSFVPVAVGFMGLGTGYLIYGPQELFGYPKRDAKVDFATGMWGIWMPGFLQFFTGAYLFAGLILFRIFTAAPLYMAGLAFTAYGVHWFALGWNRLKQADPRVNAGMSVAFTAISVLGVIVFFKAGDNPVGGLFIGLTCVYISEFIATVGTGGTHTLGERLLGFFHIGTGLWLMYLMYGVVLDTAVGYKLWI
jgi:hypothetical protein